MEALTHHPYNTGCNRDAFQTFFLSVLLSGWGVHSAVINIWTMTNLWAALTFGSDIWKQSSVSLVAVLLQPTSKRHGLLWFGSGRWQICLPCTAVSDTARSLPLGSSRSAGDSLNWTFAVLIYLFIRSNHLRLGLHSKNTARTTNGYYILIFTGHSESNLNEANNRTL